MEVERDPDPRNLIDIASKGGNYLLNIGPKADGSVPQQSIDGLRAMGGRMKMNGESIYGTAASPFEKLAWGRATQKRMLDGKTRLYLHVFDWPKDGKLVALSGDARATARLLVGAKSLRVTPADGQITIDVGASAPDTIVSVIALDLDGPLKVSR